MLTEEDYSLSELLSPDGEPFALRAPQVAILLGCGPEAARTLMKSEGFPITRLGRQYFVLKSALLAWFDELEQEERSKS